MTLDKNYEDIINANHFVTAPFGKKKNNNSVNLISLAWPRLKEYDGICCVI